MKDRVLALVGPRAVGKSTVAPIVARLLGLVFVDLDAEIESRAGASVAELLRGRGEAAFRDLEEDALRAVLARGPCVLATGGGVVTRPACLVLLREQCFTVELRALPAVLAERLERDGGAARRPALLGGDPRAELDELVRRRAPLYADCARWHLDAGERTPEDLAQRIAERYRAERASGRQEAET